MTIQLSAHSEQLILSLLHAGKFASSDEVIEEALRLVEERYQQSDQARGQARCSNTHISADPTVQQQGTLSKLLQKLDAMPTVAVSDGLSNRDHDRILYGK